MYGVSFKRQKCVAERLNGDYGEWIGEGREGFLCVGQILPPDRALRSGFLMAPQAHQRRGGKRFAVFRNYCLYVSVFVLSPRSGEWMWTTGHSLLLKS